MICGRTFETGRLRSAPHQPISSGRGQPRTCMPRKRGIRSGHRREFRVVRALRKLQRSKVGLSLNEVEVLAQQIRADLERIRRRNWNSFKLSHCRCNSLRVPQWTWTSDKCRKSNRETCRVIGSKDSPQGATLRRTTDVVENPSSSNGEPTSLLRTESNANSWTESTIPPKSHATAIWTSRIRN